MIRARNAAVAAAPEAKKDLLAALQAVIYADRRVSMHEFVVLTLLRNQLALAAGARDIGFGVAEAELMRLAGAVLDCPLPPLLEELCSL